MIESGLAAAAFRFKFWFLDSAGTMSSRSEKSAKARATKVAMRAAAIDHASPLVALPSDHASSLVAVPPPPQWSCPRKAHAAEHLLMRGSTSSLRNESRTFQVDRMWCDRLLAAAAQLGRSRHNAAFRDLIESVGGCRPVAFFLQRAYDETGRVCRTHELVTTLETAKSMSGMMTFAIVAEQAGVLHVIKGTLPTLRVPMSNQTAPVVAQCLS